MIKVENIDVYGWEAAIRGMRNPMNSWDKSDSCYGCELNNCDTCDFESVCNKRNLVYQIGENDLGLMQRLASAGSEHRKYLRMITVTMDITAPLYWWKEFDTYKVGTVANSCSTMHKIHAKDFTLDDFSHEHLCGMSIATLEHVIDNLNLERRHYVVTKDKDCWWQMIQLLPTSYNQRRTVQINYENVFNMIKQREHHKLDEWITFTDVLKELPYVKELME